MRDCRGIFGYGVVYNFIRIRKQRFFGGYHIQIIHAKLINV